MEASPVQIDLSGILMRCEGALPGFLVLSVTFLPRRLKAFRMSRLHALATYRGTSLTGDRVLIGPYSRTMPRALRWSNGGLRGVMLFLVSEVPLYPPTVHKLMTQARDLTPTKL